MLARLERMRETLACPICKDLFRVPTTATCGHTFCGVCIRRHLGNVAKCPVCLAPAQTSQLRTSKTLEDVTEAWIALEGDAVSFAGAVSGAASADSKSTTTLSATSIQTGSHTSEGVRSDAVPSDRLRSGPPLRSREHINSTEVRESVPAGSGGKALETGTCPVCEKVLPILQIQGAHIESCMRGINSSGRVFGGHATSRKQPPVPTQKPLVNYTNLSEKALKRLLADDGLPTSGSKGRLMARHREWLLHWNVNAASQRPEPIAAIRQKIADWDSARDAADSAHVRAVQAPPVAASTWSAEHEEEFAELTRQAYAKLGRPGPRKRLHNSAEESHHVFRDSVELASPTSGHVSDSDTEPIAPAPKQMRAQNTDSSRPIL